MAQEAHTLPFIAVSPQCPEHTDWTFQMDALDALLNEITSRYALLGMGGYGTWHLAAQYPQRFAALAPICDGRHWVLGFPERVCAFPELTRRRGGGG